MLRSEYQCRAPQSDDAQAMAEIYNEAINEGCHLPQLTRVSHEEMRQLLMRYFRKGWPVWIISRRGEAVGWACMQPLAWGEAVCHRTGDFSIFIAKDQQGSIAALMLSMRAFVDAQRHGFESVTTWIMSTNPKSLRFAQALGLQRWGLLPAAAHFGDVRADVEIWGSRFDDAGWATSIERLQKRLLERSKRQPLTTALAQQ